MESASEKNNENTVRIFSLQILPCFQTGELTTVSSAYEKKTRAVGEEAAVRG